MQQWISIGFRSFGIDKVYTLCYYIDSKGEARDKDKLGSQNGLEGSPEAAMDEGGATEAPEGESVSSVALRADRG